MQYDYDELICGSDTTVFKPKLQGGAGNWSNFDVFCTPTIPWLNTDVLKNGGTDQTNQPPGTLSCTPKADATASAGGVTNVDDTWFGTIGGVCYVTADHKTWVQQTGEERKEETQKRSTTVLFVKPQAWSQLEYTATTAVVSVGEVAPVFSIKKPTFSNPREEQSSSPPTNFAAHCSVTPSGIFAFDEKAKAGSVSGFPVFEIHTDGSIATMPAGTMISLLDAIDGVQVRKIISLDCAIFGFYPAPSFPILKTNIKINVTDNVCWIPQPQQKVKELVEITEGDNQYKCRRKCRGTDTCAFYAFHESKCKFYRRDHGGITVPTLRAKITNCTGERACLEITDEETPVQKYLSGHYCPFGEDAQRRAVYEKVGLSPELNMALIKVMSSRDGPSKCPDDSDADGKYVLRRFSDNDVIEAERGIIDIRGAIKLCLSTKHNVFENV